MKMLVVQLQYHDIYFSECCGITISTGCKLSDVIVQHVCGVLYDAAAVILLHWFETHGGLISRHEHQSCSH